MTAATAMIAPNMISKVARSRVRKVWGGSGDHSGCICFVLAIRRELVRLRLARSLSVNYTNLRLHTGQSAGERKEHRTGVFYGTRFCSNPARRMAGAGAI